MRPRDPFTFFVDRSLGTKHAAAAVRAGAAENERVLVHDEIYPQNEPDETWLAAAGEKGWIALTKDAEIRRRPNEIQTLLNAGTAVFIFSNGNVTAEVIALGISVAMPRIRTATRRFDVPLIGLMTREGKVSVAYVEGQRLATPKKLK